MEKVRKNRKTADELMTMGISLSVREHELLKKLSKRTRTSISHFLLSQVNWEEISRTVCE